LKTIISGGFDDCIDQVLLANGAELSSAGSFHHLFFSAATGVCFSDLLASKKNYATISTALPTNLFLFHFSIQIHM
jgi:hypothetical protein